MAEDRQGTGKHPHKSTEEPWPPTKENEGEQSSKKQDAAEQQQCRSEFVTV